MEGLVHISELSWSRVSHPSDYLNVGDKVKVFVLGVDSETYKISLGMKQLEPDPWVQVAEHFEVGQVIQGKISRLLPFGAFIRIEDKLEGLIHISELSYDHVDKVEDVLKVGDEVEARIIKLVPEEQKIGLSLKGVHGKDGEDSDQTESTESQDKESSQEKDDEPVQEVVSEPVQDEVEQPAQTEDSKSEDSEEETTNTEVAQEEQDTEPKETISGEESPSLTA